MTMYTADGGVYEVPQEEGADTYYLWNGINGQRVRQIDYEDGGMYQPTYPKNFRYGQNKELWKDYKIVEPKVVQQGSGKRRGRKPKERKYTILDKIGSFVTLFKYNGCEYTQNIAYALSDATYIEFEVIGKNALVLADGYDNEYASRYFSEDMTYTEYQVIKNLNVLCSNHDLTWSKEYVITQTTDEDGNPYDNLNIGRGKTLEDCIDNLWY